MAEATLAEAIGWTPPSGWPAISRAEAQDRLTAPGERFEMETIDIRGVPTRVWKNAPPNLRALMMLARMHGQREAFIYEDERVTFAAFHRAVAKLAAELRGRGVAKGDRVALAMRNLPEWPVAFFACVTIGAICVPLNAWWTGHELAYGLADSGTKVLICDDERWDRIAPHMGEIPALAHVFVSRAPGELAAPAQRLEDLIGQPTDWAALPDDEIPAEDIAPDDDATIFYTSGTTGQPKGALGTHRNLLTNIFSSGYGASVAAMRRGDEPPRGSGGDARVSLRQLAPAPAQAASKALDRQAWARVLGSRLRIEQSGTVNPQSRGQLSGLQAGTDLWADAHWRVGLYAGQLDSDFDVQGFAGGVANTAVGRNALRSQYLGWGQNGRLFAIFNGAKACQCRHQRFAAADVAL